jgi:hypothetical protein
MYAPSLCTLHSMKFKRDPLNVSGPVLHDGCFLTRADYKIIRDFNQFNAPLALVNGHFLAKGAFQEECKPPY